MVSGCMGEILWVELSSGELREEALPDQVYRDYVEGYGLAARLTYERQVGRVDPLGPDNLLSFSAGVLVGSGAPGTGRFTVAGKSPLMGTWGDANAGGFFGPRP